MKKILWALFAAMMVCTAVSAAESGNQTRDESKWTSISYENVPIYKIIESKDAYVIIYGKNRIGYGSTVIPKKWAAGNTGNPRKLKFRTVKGKLLPFMTVVKKDGNFMRVILNVPVSKSNSVWGVGNDAKMVNTDKESLEDLAL
ncbi:MAG: hypothetical protein M0P01_02860 [Treponema sp.]|nr:hypothetical protein [Treponema sp.]